MLQGTGIEPIEGGVRVRFTARPTGIGRLAEQAGDLRLPYVVPGGLAVLAWVVLSALHDEASVGPGLELRALLVVGSTVALAAVLSAVVARFDRPQRMVITVRRGTLEADLDGRQLQAPLDRVRLNLWNGVFTLSHPGGTELVHPYHPESLRPFLAEVARLQQAHGDRSQVPEALLQRPT